MNPLPSVGRCERVCEALFPARYARSIAILLVCTANVCRSPMAEALLATRIAERELPAAVVSAGPFP
jgi:hypothetical protein